MQWWNRLRAQTWTLYGTSFQLSGYDGAYFHIYCLSMIAALAINSESRSIFNALLACAALVALSILIARLVRKRERAALMATLAFALAFTAVFLTLLHFFGGLVSAILCVVALAALGRFQWNTQA